MEFFNQLLTSYGLLKKRKLQVTLDEKSPGAYINSYSDVKEIAQNDTERGNIAKEVLAKVDAAVETAQGAPDSVPGHYVVTSDNGDQYIKVPRQATDGEDITIGSIIGGEKRPSEGARTSYRNDLAVLYFQQAISGVVADGGESLTPETQELYSRDKVSELVNLNTEESSLGSELIGTLGDSYALANQLGIESLFDTKQTSIPFKVYQSLLGDKYQVATEEEALKGDLSKYQRPNAEAVLSSLQNLNKVLKLYQKSTTTEKITQDEYQFIKDNINRVSWKGRRSEQFRVFVKSDNPEGLGLSFDWDSRTKATELQTVLSKLEENLEKQATDGYIDYDGLNYTDITDQVSKGGLGYVIGDVAEDAGLIVSLLQQGNTKKATDLFKTIHKKHGERLTAAFGVAEGSQTGHLIGTEETEALGIDIEELKESFGSSESGEVFHRLLPTLVTAVGSDLQRMKPDFVARVGGSRAGTGGDKTDQVLFYKTQEQAEAASKLAGSKPKVAKLKDLLSKDELKKTVDAYGKAVNPNKEYHYIDDSLKCTNDSSVTNLGSGASPLKMARGFRDETDTWSQGLTDTLFNSLNTEDPKWEVNNPGIRDRVSANFEQIEKDITELNRIFDGGGTTVTPAAAQKALLSSLTDGALDSLGLAPKDRTALGKLMKKGMKGDNAIRSFKRSLEQSIIAKRIDQGSASGDVSWRATGALMMMRGCYDTSEGSKMVVNYLTGDHFRYNGNKSMMKDFKNFINTGEGWSSASGGQLGEGSSFRIGGYKCTFTWSKQTGHVGTKYEGVVDQSAKVRTQDTETSPELQTNSTDYTAKELMDKLLEIQQLVFSNLIKE
jgi:hypothetical protein